jgi:hypothetical protein
VECPRAAWCRCTGSNPPATTTSRRRRPARCWSALAFYGLDRVATVPPPIKLAHQCFGPVKGSVVYGWLFAAHQLGGAFAAWLSATTRDSTGSFQLSYILGGVMCVVAALGVLRIRPPARVVEDASTREPALV